MRPRRIVASLLSTGLLATSLRAVTSSPAHADESCSISGFSPRRVELGLTPRVVTFPPPSVSGCELAYWSIEGEDFYVYADGTQQTFYVPYDNGATSAQDVIVNAYNADYDKQIKVFANSFRLIRNTTWDKVNASPEPVRKGAKITVKGRLRIVDWANQRYTGYRGHGVALQFRTKTGSYKTVKNLTTGSGGYVSTTVSTVRGDGYWRLNYGGNTVAGKSPSAGDFVNVS